MRQNGSNGEDSQGDHGKSCSLLRTTVLEKRGEFRSHILFRRLHGRHGHGAGHLDSRALSLTIKAGRFHFMCARMQASTRRELQTLSISMEPVQELLQQDWVEPDGRQTPDPATTSSRSIGNVGSLLVSR